MNDKLMYALVLITISVSAMAQDSEFLDGYIVTNSNDTIKGLVKYVNQIPYRVLVDIKFKENEKSKSKVYPPSSILGYKAEEKIFHSLVNPSEGVKQFMELVIDGHLRLYKSTVTGFGAPQYGPANTERFFLLKKSDKTLFIVSKGKFKDRLSEYLADNATVSEKVKSGQYKKRNIEEIVKEYNNSKR
jgi:hypothetical protein